MVDKMFHLKSLDIQTPTWDKQNSFSHQHLKTALEDLRDYSADTSFSMGSQVNYATEVCLSFCYE